MKEMLMKHKVAVLFGSALVLGMVILTGVTILSSQQKSQASAAQKDKIAALKELHDTGVITDQEYNDKVAALKTVSLSTPARHSSKASWSSTRKAEIVDPQYQMTAYTIDVPEGWKFAGTMIREGGCHSTGAALKLTEMSPDGQITLVRLPGVTWTWTTNEQTRQFAAKGHCPNIDIDSASGFLTKIVIPNLRPNATDVTVQPLQAEGQEALAKQLEQQKENNEKLPAQFRPQNVTLEGARAIVHSLRDGQPVEEEISTVVTCSSHHQNAMYAMPASDTRTCSSRGESIVRAPQGQVEALVEQPKFKELGKSLAVNNAWFMRTTQDQQAAFQQQMNANNAAFKQNLDNNQRQFDQRIQNQKQFDANLRASTDRAMAQDRARQDAIDASAHNMVNYSLDQQDFKNPNTGQTITASNQYNHQWISSDGSTLIQTNDHTYDPNGQVYPVSQSWSELVPK